MAIVAEELYSLLIPLHSESLVVPRVCVAEVIRYHVPAAAEQPAGWFRDVVRPGSNGGQWPYASGCDQSAGAG
jgi:hypothetical protein